METSRTGPPLDDRARSAWSNPCCPGALSGDKEPGTRVLATTTQVTENATAKALAVSEGWLRTVPKPKVVAPLSNGGFTVVWGQKDLSVPDNGWDIWGNAFTPGGKTNFSSAGPAFRINTFLYGDQYGPKIAAAPSGRLVVWTTMGQDGSFEGIAGRFLQGGTAVAGGEMHINTTTLYAQKHPAVAWNGANDFLVVWTSFVGTNGFALYGQAYTLNPLP